MANPKPWWTKPDSHVVTREMRSRAERSQRRHEKSLARRKPSRASPPRASAKNEGRIEGFLAGACATALAWLFTAKAKS